MARDKALRNLINDFEKTPIYLALYVDKEFRFGFK